MQIRATVQRCADKPCLGAVSVPVLRRLLPQPEEHLLIHVLRIGDILHPGQGQPVNRGAISIHGIAELCFRHAMPPFLCD